MKAIALYIAIFTLALLTIPMIALGFDISPVPDGEVQVHTPGPSAGAAAATPPMQVVDVPEENIPEARQPQSKTEPEQAVPTSAAAGVEFFLILDETTGEVAKVSSREFVRGAVAAELPASFHTEAMKAQAVAAHTFAIHNHLVQRASPDPALKGADFAADPQNLKVYMTEAQAREFYGDMADFYWNKITAAADAVEQYVLEYDDEPIVAAYHAISAGQTEDAANVWSGSAPYLAPADSEGDLLAPDYETTTVVSAETLRAALLSAYPDIQLGDDPAQWLGGSTRSGSGYVVELEVGDKTLHGKELRQLLDLRSHNFDVVYENGGFAFIVYGYGHGVGLSQYGADFLARQGYDYRQILAHYYSGATLKQLVYEAEQGQ